MIRLSGFKQPEKVDLLDLRLSILQCQLSKGPHRSSSPLAKPEPGRGFFFLIPNDIVDDPAPGEPARQMLRRCRQTRVQLSTFKIVIGASQDCHCFYSVSAVNLQEPVQAWRGRVKKSSGRKPSEKLQSRILEPLRQVTFPTAANINSSWKWKLPPVSRNPRRMSGYVAAPRPILFLRPCLVDDNQKRIIVWSSGWHIGLFFIIDHLLRTRIVRPCPWLVSRVLQHRAKPLWCWICHNQPGLLMSLLTIYHLSQHAWVVHLLIESHISIVDHLS